MFFKHCEVIQVVRLHTLHDVTLPLGLRKIQSVTAALHKCNIGGFRTAALLFVHSKVTEGVWSGSL